jgi:hypothetical protein
MLCSYIFLTMHATYPYRKGTYGHLVLLVDSISIPLLSHLAGEGGGREGPLGILLQWKVFRNDWLIYQGTLQSKQA